MLRLPICHLQFVILAGAARRQLVIDDTPSVAKRG
jgi:hypothetical protein